MTMFVRACTTPCGTRRGRSRRHQATHSPGFQLRGSSSFDWILPPGWVCRCRHRPWIGVPQGAWRPFPPGFVRRTTPRCCCPIQAWSHTSNLGGCMLHVAVSVFLVCSSSLYFLCCHFLFFSGPLLSFLCPCCCSRSVHTTLSHAILLMLAVVLGGHPRCACGASTGWSLSQPGPR